MSLPSATRATRMCARAVRLSARYETYCPSGEISGSDVRAFTRCVACVPSARTFQMPAFCGLNEQ